VFSASVLKNRRPWHSLAPSVSKSGRDVNKLAKTAFKEGVSGCPLIIEHALSVLEAKVINEVDLGTHTVFIGDVLSSETLKAGTPLTYQYYHQVLKGKSSPNAPTYESKNDAPLLHASGCRRRSSGFRRSRGEGAVMLKRVDAGVLSVAYEESGSANAGTVLLLHGFPYDVHAYDDVTPLLVAAGCRVIAPYLRGFGPRAFCMQRRCARTTGGAGPRPSGLHGCARNQSGVLAGYDWGGRAACIVAACGLSERAGWYRDAVTTFRTFPDRSSPNAGIRVSLVVSVLLP